MHQIIEHRHQRLDVVKVFGDAFRTYQALPDLLLSLGSGLNNRTDIFLQHVQVFQYPPVRIDLHNTTQNSSAAYSAYLGTVPAFEEWLQGLQIALQQVLGSLYVHFCIPL